jgi:hypothetical protein
MSCRLPSFSLSFSFAKASLGSTDCWYVAAVALEARLTDALRLA